MISSTILHPELLLINTLVFKPLGFELTNVEAEKESQEYVAHTFRLNECTIKFRVAKITPTKTGQFVTIWKRNEKGITTPFDHSDDIDGVVIVIRKVPNFGVFIFPKDVLHEKKIISDKTRDGKRGIRVYPIWDETTSKQAHQTQRWQTNYFLDLSQDLPIDLERAKELLNLSHK